MMTIRYPTTRDAPRRGQAIVEFALILPLFVLLVFGAIELGRAMLRVHLLNNAVRDGARVGTLPGSVEQNVIDKVDSFLQLQGMQTGTWATTVAVTAPDGSPREGGLANAMQGDLVTVTLTNQFNILTGSVIPGFSGTKTLTAKCVFRHE